MGRDEAVVDEALVERARRLADEELFPRALETDASPVLPVARLDALAASGFYGIVGPREAGGLEADPRTFGLVMEAFAGGCLTTAFVWAQHHSAVRTISSARPAVRDAWLGALCSGALRAGVAYGSLRRPGPALLVARPAGTGFVLDGTAPWVTGWGRTDVVHVAARTDDGRVVWALVDATPEDGISAAPLRLAAVAASATVTLGFDNHRVPEERVTLVEQLGEWRRRDLAGLRPNGSLALGVAGRCARLLAAPDLHAELAAARSALDRADVDSLGAARARASQLALHAATRLVVAGGGRAVLLEDHAQRIFREAMFLLVFGQAAVIRSAQLELLTGRCGSEQVR